MMAGLPSYEEATTRQDWLDLVAPYVSFKDYRSLSLVSSRFWRIFAPRLWDNPLQSVRLAGLDPSDGMSFCVRILAARARSYAAMRRPDLTLLLLLWSIALTPFSWSASRR